MPFRTKIYTQLQSMTCLDVILLADLVKTSLDYLYYVVNTQKGEIKYKNSLLK